MDSVLQTERLYLRKLTPMDKVVLQRILQDEEVMYAYEHAFSDEEVENWLQRQLDHYAQDGIGLWAVIRRSDEQLIGQCGLTWQDVGEQKLLEIGYLFEKAVWHHGYAIEAVQAVREYAFQGLGAPKVYSIIRDNNVPSQKVAQRNGMVPCGKIIKSYYGMEMPHIIYGVVNPQVTKKK